MYCHLFHIISVLDAAGCWSAARSLPATSSSPSGPSPDRNRRAVGHESPRFQTLCPDVQAGRYGYPRIGLRPFSTAVGPPQSPRQTKKVVRRLQHSDVSRGFLLSGADLHSLDAHSPLRLIPIGQCLTLTCSVSEDTINQSHIVVPCLS